MRRSVVLGLALAGLLSWSAVAATPEEDYLAARDSAIAQLKSAEQAAKQGPSSGNDDKLIASDNQARLALEQQMRRIIGPVAIKGMAEIGTLNLDTLMEGDEGFGALDGLIFTSPDRMTSVIVTTDRLFQHWLAEHKDWWGKDSAPMPQQAADAVHESAFYTQAVITDAAIIRFAALPVSKPAGAGFAFAMLAARSQDDTPAKADEIFIATARGGRVFIGQTKEFAAVGPIAACDAKRAAQVKAARERTDDQADRLIAQSEADFLRCFAEQAAQQKTYAGAVAAAQNLIDRALGQ